MQTCVKEQLVSFESFETCILTTRDHLPIYIFLIILMLMTID